MRIRLRSRPIFSCSRPKHPPQESYLGVLLHHWILVSICGPSEELVEKCRGMIGHADDLVRRLAIEFEVELRFGPPVAPIGKALELGATETTLRERSTSNGDADAR